MAAHIVGLRMALHQLSGKFNTHHNHPAATRAAIALGLAREPRCGAKAIAESMRNRH